MQLTTAADEKTEAVPRAAIRWLLRWAKERGRKFPWRTTAIPYEVLLAEKLLQQTAARDVVIRTYETILEKYPTVEELASADLAFLTETVAPLGLRYRAKELRAIARFLVNEHGGRVPSTLNHLLAIPGVGDYMARAVLSFAFEKHVAVVDTNVARFLHRFFGIKGRLPANPARKRSLLRLAESLLPRQKSKDFNLAILDLCAIICRPSRPNCAACPVARFCVYGRQAPVERSNTPRSKNNR
jgi:A/G-specific adenine glycosylase